MATDASCVCFFGNVLADLKKNSLSKGEIHTHCPCRRIHVHFEKMGAFHACGFVMAPDMGLSQLGINKWPYKDLKPSLKTPDQSMEVRALLHACQRHAALQKQSHSVPKYHFHEKSVHNYARNLV
jgi:hypothetical protein